MNIEVNKETLEEITNAFRFNDAVIRNLIIKRNLAITESSPMSKMSKPEYSSGGGDDRDNHGNGGSNEEPRKSSTTSSAAESYGGDSA
jgi:small subunit ribosomal protein S6